MKIKLSPRLEAIAGCVDGTSSMADIGTDHGYLPVYLVENAMTASAIASDTNQQPLKKAEKIISELQLEKQIETRLGSGLSVLKPGEVETVVMAGMGGLLIRDLLEAQSDVAMETQKLVLQPMNNQAVLRKYLEAAGFRIIREELAQEENRVYQVIVAKPGKMVFTNDLEYQLGFEFYTQKHPLLTALIDRKIFLEQQIVLSTRGKTTAVAAKQWQESSLFIEKLNEVKKWLSN
ncbi:class I SAM-dependent methyltransferase [uncultured Acetobacterium sp.]|uniref:tRNA (adenine(22)-N(1))-methyltransferase n=1 Tax=uncultured Acetobacterium sp. TaxID=217139 RepID=UPI0024297DFC|nr:class I SAM-dependent methyltransferase [uncultured Acetobacterium sp.]MBU4541861.1 class I SAM-dependent methyltransferase [Bacillota bacterium]MDP2842788.1 class I SAM-dependent methyltransferase [Acetobacterium sp.]